MGQRFDGRVVLVTGGARGMGAAEARRFAAEGARVAVADVLDEEGAALAAELGDRGCYIHLDVRRQEEWNHAVEQVVDRFGKLDALVNNAGVMLLGRVEDMSPADFMSMVETNQLGVFLGMQAVIPALRAVGGGTIVNISSTAGLAGDMYLAAYCASKFAVIGMSRVAAMELGPENIRVNTVCPGIVDTGMTQDLHAEAMAKLARQLPRRRFGTTEEVASAVLFLTGDESSYMTGTETVVDGGRLAGILPAW
ncbi:glucose 1-dehydrogenase [Streptomyces sp. NPDC048417]|uniref:SDR family NAD(P)-dependent oxidoreductase n=1 Tax=Streptomyces sp. NPDC048417 TaxID=3155387 RepID=UPI00343D3943